MFQLVLTKVKVLPKAITTLMVVMIVTTIALAPTHSEAMIATGDPIDFVTTGDFTNSSTGELFNILNAGINFSFNNTNTIRNGVWGRPLRLIERSNVETNLTYAILNETLATYPNLTGVVAVNEEVSVNATIQFVQEHNMSFLQPTVGTRRFFQFSKDWVNFIPSPDADIYNMVRHAIYTHQATRIAFVTETTGLYGNEMLADLTTLIESVGAKMTYHMKLDRIGNRDSYDLALLQQLIASKPHAIINMGVLTPNNAATIIAILGTLPDVLTYFPAGLLPLVDAALRELPSRSLIKERVILTSYGPLYTDTSYEATVRFRSELAANSNSQINLAVLDASPPLGVYMFLGWFLGELIASIAAGPQAVNAVSIKTEIFADKFYSVNDNILGPFSGPCTGERTQFCSCNNGARINSLIRYTEQLSLVAVPDSRFTLPYTSCDAEKLPLTSPLIAATLTPSSSPEAARVTSDYLAGRSAAANTGDILVDGALIVQTYTGNSTAALQTLNTEKLMTASAGTVLNTPIATTAAGLGAVIDPIELRPRLYGSFRRDVVYVSPTYDQELHALAHLAVSQQVGISVLSALEDGSEVGAMLTRSVNTFGQEGGGHRSASTIADGLASQADASGITILHGIASTADIAAIAAYLARTSSGVVAIPMAHLNAWYREIVAAVTDTSHQGRIVFATSLPNWGGPASGENTGSALQTYFDRVPATNRTPSSLRGFMTHQLLTQITGRIPGQKTPTEFLQMLYGASVVVMDTGLVVGPYFDTACSSTASSSQQQGDSCEINVGARWIRVRSIAASVTDHLSGNSTGVDASSITLDSGRISYQGLPTTDNTVTTIVTVVAVVGALLVVAGIAAVVVVCCCTGRSNWAAPKDESEAFTIAFTDIQSSTALWAEAPEAMAPALDHHHALIRKLCSKHSGYEVKTIGDAFMIAFRDARDAVELASALQFDFLNDKTWSPQIDHAYLEMDHRSTQTLKADERAMYSIALSQEDYGRVWNGLRVRVGVHTGFGEIKKDPVSHGYDYYGTVVNTAARTEAIAHGGQVIMTEACIEAAGVDPSRLLECGPVLLRGVNEPVHMYQLGTVPNRVFPRLRIENAQREVDELDAMGNSSVTHRNPNTNSCLSQQLSLRGAAHQTQRQQQQHRATVELLRSISGVMSKKRKIEWLQALSKEWRIQSQPSDDANTDAILDRLATKLAPIFAKQPGLNNLTNSDPSEQSPSTMMTVDPSAQSMSLLNIPGSLVPNTGSLLSPAGANNSAGAVFSGSSLVFPQPTPDTASQQGVGGEVHVKRGSQSLSSFSRSGSSSAQPNQQTDERFDMGMAPLYLMTGIGEVNRDK